MERIKVHSYVKVKATNEEMEKLFDNTESGFLIKLIDTIEEGKEKNLYKVNVRHREDIGYQDDKIFTYDTFLKKFENESIKEMYDKEREEKNKRLYEEYRKDIELAKKGIEGGLTAKAVAKVLKIYGSSNCADEKYIKTLMKTEEIQSLIQKNKKAVGIAR